MKGGEGNPACVYPCVCQCVCVRACVCVCCDEHQARLPRGEEIFEQTVQKQVRTKKYAVISWNLAGLMSY